MTVRSAIKLASYLTQISTLDSIRADIDELENDIPIAIKRLYPGDPNALLPSGVRE
jgi:hypothetical protein